jgi:hypothetical protein
MAKPQERGFTKIKAKIRAPEMIVQEEGLMKKHKALLKHVVPSGKALKSSPSCVKYYAVERYLHIHCKMYGRFLLLE